MVEALRQDIREFKAKNNCSRAVVIWTGSTEIYVPVNEKIHGTLADLEAVNNLYQQYTMLKNAIREMGGYEADEEID